jgi:UDP-2,4-diacetamido-2,4,6-trideoxy-beta-L-altropyranose hydrolase
MIAFRTTAGKAIGFGHLRRCLTLAAELKKPGAPPIRFWIDGDQQACDLAQDAGFEAHPVSASEPGATAAFVDRTGVEVLVADSYAIAESAFSYWRHRLRCLVVVDDLADRFIDADAVLNGSPNATALRYRTAPNCALWLGPEYALLRPIFRGLPKHETTAAIGTVLVTLGGADPGGAMMSAVGAVKRALPAANLDVVVGPLFGPVPQLDEMAREREPAVRVHRGVEDMVPLMMRADIAVSGGGQTLYELAATGVPTVAICLAANQKGNIDALAGTTLLAGGGVVPGQDWAPLENACRKLAAEPDLRRSMSVAGQALIDGNGAARAADMIRSLAGARHSARHG